MAYATPSQIREMGHLPVYRHPACLKAHNKIIYGPQMAVNSSQREPFNGSCSRDIVKRKLRCNDVVNKRCSNANIEAEKKLTSSSVSLPEWSTMLYSSTMMPKAPDKHARCIDYEQNTEVQIAPQSGEKDRAGTTQPQYLYDSLTRTHQ